MQFIKYPSIEQFRHVTKYIQKINDTAVVEATGTEKIHGTNAAVSFLGDEMYVQSRNNIITEMNDNAGCAKWCNERKDQWMKVSNRILEQSGYNHLDRNDIITIFFEFAGGSIQKNSALSGLDKSAMVFSYYVASSVDNIEDQLWLSTEHCEDTSVGIYNVNNLPKYHQTIDFRNIASANNAMIKITEEVEANSPTGKFLGVDGNIGEGVVWSFWLNNTLFQFKVKGEKHSKSKVVTLSPLDEERMNNIVEFANSAVTPSRLEQAWNEIFGLNNEKEEPSMKRIGEFLKWVNSDIAKEEYDILEEKKLVMKDVGKACSNIARKWFIDQYSDLSN